MYDLPDYLTKTKEDYENYFYEKILENAPSDKTMSEILDSGARREFSTGAVRDIQENKGRCDLLPLDVVARLIMGANEPKDSILLSINSFVYTGDKDELLLAVHTFCREFLGCDVFTALLEVSKHYEEGAIKYQPRNWEKGIDLHCYIDSGVRHYLKYRRGDRDEPHDRAFIWNMLGAVWTYEHKPELIDLPFNEKRCKVAPQTEGNAEAKEIFKRHIETCFG